MTYKTLLELAAKAAGIELGWGIYERGFWMEPESKCFHRTDTGLRKEWNPLDDDGDALRLAVKLDMAVSVIGGVTYVRWSYEGEEVVQVHRKDPYAATRRAIVLAAAEIGKDMK